MKIDQSVKLKINYGDGTSITLDALNKSSYPYSIHLTKNFSSVRTYYVKIKDFTDLCNSWDCYTNYYYSNSIQVYAPVSPDFDLNDSESMVSILGTGADLTNCLGNCSNKGYCARMTNGNYVCVCNTDYTGTRCQLNKRLCSSNPCLNNGTCNETLQTDGTYSFKCNCSQKYSGLYCELFSLSELCANLTCSNHGYCFVNSTNLNVSCACYKYYSGKNCEIVSDSIKTIQAVTRTSFVIAVISIALIYCGAVVNDTLTLCIKKPVKIKKKIIRYKYRYVN